MPPGRELGRAVGEVSPGGRDRCVSGLPGAQKAAQVVGREKGEEETRSALPLVVLITGGHCQLSAAPCSVQDWQDSGGLLAAPLPSRGEGGRLGGRWAAAWSFAAAEDALFAGALVSRAEADEQPGLLVLLLLLHAAVRLPALERRLPPRI